MAGKSYLGAFGGANFLGAAANYFISLGHDFFSSAMTTEAPSQIKATHAFTASMLTARVSTNGRGSASTVVLRVNGASSALTVTVPASTTGRFQDLSNTASVAVNDLFCVMTATAGASGNFVLDSVWLMMERATGNPITYFSHRPGFSSGTNTTWGQMFASRNFGWNSGGSALTTIGSNTPMPVAGVFSNLRVIVSANTKATLSCTVRLAKNGAAGNSLITVAAGVTGTFEDTSNTDTVAEGDTIGWELTTAGTGTFTIDNIQTTFASTGLECPVLHGNGSAIAAGATTFYAFLGGRNNQTEAAAQIPALFAATVEDMWLKGNFIAANFQSDFRVAGADSGISVLASGAGVATLHDNTNSIVVAVGDLLATEMFNNTASIQNATSFAGGFKFRQAAPANAARPVIIQQAA